MLKSANAPVLARYSSSESYKYFIDNENFAIHDEINNRVFRIIKEFEKEDFGTVPIVEFNKVNYDVIEIVENDPKRVFEFHGLSLDEAVNETRVFDKWFQKEWDLVVETYNDLISWQLKLNEISDGYSELHVDEIFDEINKSNQIIRSISINIDEKLWENYFQGYDSTIEDLSVKDGIRYFQWGNMRNPKIYTYTTEKLGAFRNFEVEEMFSEF